MTYHAVDPNMPAELVNFPGTFVPEDLPDDVLSPEQLQARARRDELVARYYPQLAKSRKTKAKAAKLDNSQR